VSGYLIDTNVVSEPNRARPNRGVVAWLHAVEDSAVHVSVITLGELRYGIARTTDATTRARLERFFGAFLARFSGRILPVSDGVAGRWGRLRATLTSSGIALSTSDTLIAATALEHDLTVVTRNVRHFAPTLVDVLDPFAPNGA
jgi:predicted nucleic acid-binding protein